MTGERNNFGQCKNWGCFRNDKLELQSLHTEESLQGEGDVGNTRHRRMRSDARGVAGAFRKQSSPLADAQTVLRFYYGRLPRAPRGLHVL